MDQGRLQKLQDCWNKKKKSCWRWWSGSPDLGVWSHPRMRRIGNSRL